MFAVIGTAVRVFFRHWPVMFVLLLLGLALRNGIIWLAVWGSNIHAAVGMLIFALVPLCLLGAMLLIMRLIRASLPGPAGRLADNSPRASTVGMMASVMVPFLGVYAALDLLKQDRQFYVYLVAKEEIFSGGTGIQDRLPFSLNPLTVTVVAIALVFRLAFMFSRKARSFQAIGWFQAYVEVIWLTLAASVLDGFREPALLWTAQRQVFVWLETNVDRLIATLGPFASYGQWIKEWTANMFSAIDYVIIIPLAWLAMGAVFYGRKFRNTGPALPTQLESRWKRLPAAMRRMTAPVRSDAREGFSPLMDGLRTIRHAGVRTMLMFCLAFAAAAGIPKLLWELERLLVGAQDFTLIWLPASVVFSLINRTITLTVMLCLIAATIDYVLHAEDRQAGPAPAPAPPSGQGQPGEFGVPVVPGNPDSNRFGALGQHEVSGNPVVN